MTFCTAPVALVNTNGIVNVPPGAMAPDVPLFVGEVTLTVLFLVQLKVMLASVILPLTVTFGLVPLQNAEAATGDTIVATGLGRIVTLKTCGVILHWNPPDGGPG